jgi:hypothetical protein
LIGGARHKGTIEILSHARAPDNSVKLQNENVQMTNR